MTETRSEFWDFSLRFYARPGVAATCLELQDQAGADINVVLYLFFLASRCRRLDAAETARLDAAVAVWREQVVRPLRAVRRSLKTMLTQPDDAISRLRDDIKRSELAAEKFQQHTIERLFPLDTFGYAAESPEKAIRASLNVYTAGAGALPADAVGKLIELFIAQDGASTQRR